MLLVIDVGNSHTVLGLYEGDELVAHWRVVTTTHRTSDELRILFLNLLEERGFDVKNVDGCCMSSVVPELNHALHDMCRQTFDAEPLLVGPGVKTGLIIQTENPKEVGADRIVNSVAAFDELGGPLIIVDFGTATTFDAISDKGEYLGGAIVPGIEISAEALSEKCAKLPRVEISKTESPIGRDTISAVRAGLTYGYADLVDGLIVRIEREIGGKANVVATGGMAQFIGSMSNHIGTIDQWLTLKGLRIIHAKNHGPA
jgi:type III pantothenate kinase